jgi:basic amino acid/polyamine antiporter, APA family
VSAATTEAPPLDPVSGAAFVRQSSGLVKLGTPWRILVMAVTVNGIGLFMANFYVAGPGTFPHMNLMLAVLFACSAQFLFNGAYALLAGAFPRSGGEYVYISRVLGPFVGFVANVGAYVAFCFYAAVGAFLCVTFGLSPLLAVYGVITDATWATDAGTWLADTNHALLIGTAIVIASTVLCCFSMRVYYRYQAITFWAGMTCFVVLLVVMLVSSHADFVDGLNAFGQKTGAGANVYDAVTANAQKAGVPSGYTLWATLSMAALLTTVTPTGYVGGEVRTPLRTQLTGMLGGTAIIAAIFLIVPLLISHVVGLDWNKDAAVLNSAGQFPVSQTPLYTFYAFVLTTSPVLLIVMGLGLLLLTAILVPQQIFMPTRMIFAWSFDRLVPPQLARVNPRTGAPVIATLFTAVVVEALLILFAKGKIGYFNPILIVGTVWGIVGLTAFLFPILPRARRQWEASPIQFKVAGIPVLSILGAISVAYWALAVYIAFTTDALGANKSSNLWFCALTFAIPMVYFAGAYAFRQRQGVNLNATFAELPPE